jgi:hypothetical protein
VEVGIGELAENLEVVRKHLQGYRQGATGAELGSFLLPKQSLEEFPNTVAPSGKRRNSAGALDGAERGKKAMSHQIYKITRRMADQDRAALKVESVGTPGCGLWQHSCTGTNESPRHFWTPRREDHQAEELTTVMRLGDARVGEVLGYC